MQTKLFKIPLIIIFVILLAGALYWYLNYRLTKATSAPSIEEVTKGTIETKETGDKGIKSIPLEKPPFIKD